MKDISIMIDINGSQPITPLYKVLKSGNYKKAMLLIDKNNINQPVQFGETPLYIAAKYGCKRLTRALLDAGANPNQETALQKATAESNENAISGCLQANESPNMISPLCAATENGHLDVMEILLAHGANVDQLSPLGIAIQKQKKICFELRLQNASIFNFSAMHIAASRGDLHAMQLLLKYGAKIDYSASGFSHPELETVHSSTPLHAAAATGQLEAAKFLLDQGAKINQKAFIGDSWPFEYAKFTPLHFAARNGKHEMIKLLLDRGAKIEAVAYFGRWRFNIEGGTPLYYAAAEGHEHAVKILLDRGANANKSYDFKDEHKGPLHIATYHGYIGIMRMLLDHGVSANQQFRRIFAGKTPLQLAIAQDKKEAVKLLLEKGAFVTEKMFKEARDKRYVELAALLEHAYKLQQLHLVDDGYPLRHYAIQALKATPLCNLDKAIALFKRIDAFDVIADTISVYHPHESKKASSFTLGTAVDKAFKAFTQDTTDEDCVATLDKEALSVSKAAREGHEREGFFGRFRTPLTQCDLEQKINTVLKK